MSDNSAPCEWCSGSGWMLDDASTEYGSSGIGHYIEVACTHCEPCPVCLGWPHTPQSVDVGRTGYPPVMIDCSHPCHSTLPYTNTEATNV